MRCFDLKHIGFFALLVAFLVPLALHATVHQEPGAVSYSLCSWPSGTAPTASYLAPQVAPGNLAVPQELSSIDGIFASNQQPNTKHFTNYYLSGKDLPIEQIAVVAASKVAKPLSAPASAFERLEPLANQQQGWIKELTAKMKANGWQGDPISVFEHNGSKYILDGHHRAAAARAAGIDVPYVSVPATQLQQFGYKSVDAVIWAAAEAGGF